MCSPILDVNYPLFFDCKENKQALTEFQKMFQKAVYPLMYNPEF